MWKVVLYPFSGLQKDLSNIWAAFCWIVAARARILFAFCKFVWVARRLSEPAQSLYLAKMAHQVRQKGMVPFGICYRCTGSTSELLRSVHRSYLSEAAKNPIFDFNRRRVDLFDAGPIEQLENRPD